MRRVADARGRAAAVAKAVFLKAGQVSRASVWSSSAPCTHARQAAGCFGGPGPSRGGALELKWTAPGQVHKTDDDVRVYSREATR